MKTIQKSPRLGTRRLQSIQAMALGCAFFAACTLLAHAATVTVTDNFDSAHDYSTGDVTGTIWTGAYTGNNPSSAFNANTTDAGTLTMSDVNGKWDNGQNTGHLLYVSVTGDFTMTLELTAQSRTDWTSAGLGAFAPNDLTDSAGSTINWVGMGTQQLYGFLDFSIINGVTSKGQSSGDSAPIYMKLSRVGNDFITYYSTDGANYTEKWTITRADLASTLDVGIWEASFSSSTATTQFDNFSLTYAAVPESSTWALIVGGVGMLALGQRMRHSKI